MALNIIVVSCSIESKLLSGFKIQDGKSQCGYKNTIEILKLKGSNMMCNNITKKQKLKTAAKNTVNAGNKWIKNITKGNAAYIKKVIHRDDVHMCSMYCSCVMCTCYLFNSFIARKGRKK